MTRTLHLANLDATEALGERLGEALEPGDFVGLMGELGAGKTSLVRGIARGAGVPRRAQVSSPTFALVNTYEGGRLVIMHADLYRVSDAEELYDAGFYDLVGNDAALLVEWVDRVPQLPPESWLEVRLTHLEEGRKVEFVAHGGRWGAWLAKTWPK